jgi:hypothetical protein
MKYKINLVFFFIIILAIISCNSKVDIINQQIQPTAYILQTPSVDKVNIVGRIISKNTNLAIADIDVWLAKVLKKGDEVFYILDTVNSPSIMSNEHGYFQFIDIDPGEYVIVIGNPEIKYEIITNEFGKAKVWNFNAGNIENVGDLLVSLK